ncbi:FAD-dependent monooxygenase [Streptomyces sp. NPDC093060]|uniref:FAD-dependent monooxygenase n=1 Tax=Streptomyces sp. NPDC093060 TaxID=3366019 RepID=UPI003806387D
MRPGTCGAALYDREPLRRWSTARTTLLGDAVHPMPPRHGQGANQAVEDGVALAVCLAEAGPGGDGIAAVLARYEAVRRPHTTCVQLGSRDGGGRGPGKGVRDQAAGVRATSPERGKDIGPHSAVRADSRVVAL